MSELPYFLERTIVIGAPPEIVFRYFTDPVRFAAWWGAGSDIDCRPGGRVHIRYPDGTVAGGMVVEAEFPNLLVFTYGYEGAGKPILPGASRVTIRLTEEAAGTRLHLRHDVPTAELLDEHTQGWRYQLSLFANVVCRELFAGAQEKVDAYLSAWSEPDASARRALLGSSLTEDVSFHDAYACLRGIDDLNANLAAVQRFMPGMMLRRAGELRQCQESALGDWSAEGPDGAVKAKGTNAYDFAPDGRIRRVVGFWG
ncbi:MAG: SRPBCC family protein [Thermoanaerobaculia bacterium]